MAGIYIHIPFCKQACHYCNFHFTTSLRYKNDLINALLLELTLQKEYLGNAPIETIYFGGGTPSLLSGQEIEALINKIYKVFSVVALPEITLEANPDDLTNDKLQDFKLASINRLSIGVQSFNEKDLIYMNRSHNATQSHAALKLAAANGFTNISIDLIYGTPTLNKDQWIDNLRASYSYNIPHLSCYSLTVEPNTMLEKMINNQQMKPVKDTKAAMHFQLLMDEMTAKGYEHYEISNFCRPGAYAKHNTGYWQNKKYLGVGPAAHSFDGVSRQWNVNNNNQYIKSISALKIPFTKELLTKEDQFNEYILVSLRNKWGCDLQKIKDKFGKDQAIYLLSNAQKYIDRNLMLYEKNILYLTSDGKLVADNIIADLFLA